jgi:hypothetical protein
LPWHVIINMAATAQVVWADEAADLATTSAGEAALCLRVTGRLVQVHVGRQLVVLAHRSGALTVDTRLIHGALPPLRTLVQATGELSDAAPGGVVGEGGERVLLARLLVSVDGLDERAYDRALRLRRAALA